TIRPWDSKSCIVRISIAILLLPFWRARGRAHESGTFHRVRRYCNQIQRPRASRESLTFRGPAAIRGAVDWSLTPQQVELVDRARRLAVERFAPRAAKHDREASFPFEDFRDLRDARLLMLCIPKVYGGLGEGFETYCLVAEQIAQGNASTALCYNMHTMTMLQM